MPHIIEIADATFERMQTLAEPLVDNSDSLICRALDALELANGKARPVAGESSVRNFDPAAPPSLAHTTPKSMTLCGVELPKSETYWNNLMIAVIREAAKRGMTPEQLDEMLTIKSMIGRKEDAGYKYLWDVGVSVQGQDANAAWRQTYEIATRLGLMIEVVFIWQNAPKAAMPNAAGRFVLNGAG